MSRSGYGYVEDLETGALNLWRANVYRAIHGRRGQAFLREMLAALDALPEPRLVAFALQENGAVCAMGAVGKARGIDMSTVDPDDRESVAAMFKIATALACEIAWMNDEAAYPIETPEQRWSRMRAWVVAQLANSTENDHAQP